MKHRSLRTLTSAFVLIFVVGLLPWSSSFGQQRKAGCKGITQLSDYPITGCADPKTQVSDAASYRAKQTIPPATAPLHRLTLDDFSSLQEQAKKIVGENRVITGSERPSG